MDFKIRTTKTKSAKTAVQVIRFVNRKTIVLKHLGSADRENEIMLLKKQAKLWIQNEIDTKGLFQKEHSFHLQYQYLGFTYSYAYTFLQKIFERFAFHTHTKKLFQDLVIARILEPRSKRKSLEFLHSFLGVTHSESAVYKALSTYSAHIKEKIETEMVRIARSDFGFDFSFVLYDVTTLYFESFESDSFRETGFSKDHKHNQPQVVIGLIVTKDGFPIGYEVFKGDTFEGNTFIPIITAFKTRNKIESLTVVADSAMLSQKNIEAMQKEGLHYILSSRLANLKQSLLDQIDTALPRTNSAHIRIENLIVDFSSKRYRKDKREMDKQIEKAKKKITDSTKKVTNVKYVSNEKTKCFVNQALIDKHTKLLGLKGYVTDLTLPDTEIIAFYHNLFTVEHAFRIAKSDLETRPIYHRKEDSIRNHILICFMALSLSVYLELKNKASIESITEKLKQVTDALILDVITGKITHERVQKTRDIEELERLSY